MRVAYIGNFEPEYSTENDVRKAFEKLGHQVIKRQENQLDVNQLRAYDYDLLLTSKEEPWFKVLENIESDKKTYVRMCLRRKENIRHEPRIKLSTIHGSKGSEADNVMLLTGLSRKSDEAYWSQRDEERRVFYVGMTRARNNLDIVRSQTDREFTEAF